MTRPAKTVFIKRRRFDLLQLLEKKAKEKPGKIEGGRHELGRRRSRTFRGVARPPTRFGDRAAGATLRHFQRRHAAATRAGPAVESGKDAARLRHRRKETRGPGAGVLADRPRALSAARIAARSRSRHAEGEDKPPATRPSIARTTTKGPRNRRRRRRSCPTLRSDWR